MSYEVIHTKRRYKSPGILVEIQVRLVPCVRLFDTLNAKKSCARTLNETPAQVLIIFFRAQSSCVESQLCIACYSSACTLWRWMKDKHLSAVDLGTPPICIFTPTLKRLGCGLVLYGVRVVSLLWNILYSFDVDYD